MLRYSDEHVTPVQSQLKAICNCSSAASVSSSVAEKTLHSKMMKALLWRVMFCAEITAFASEERLGVDFSEIWNQSGLAK